jgi:hypothetical protein
MRFWRTLQREILWLGKHKPPTGVTVAQTNRQPDSYHRNRSTKTAFTEGKVVEPSPLSLRSI